MKDSVERLKDKGNSALLFHMAESIGSVAEMSGFACLESVAIGSECFTKGMGVLEMSHCDGLKSVRIGKGSFVHWSGFVLRDCGVEEVEIGDGCFVDCEKVVFEGGGEGMKVKSRFGEIENASSWK